MIDNNRSKIPKLIINSIETNDLKTSQLLIKYGHCKYINPDKIIKHIIKKHYYILLDIYLSDVKLLFNSFEILIYSIMENDINCFKTILYHNRCNLLQIEIYKAISKIILFKFINISMLLLLMEYEINHFDSYNDYTIILEHLAINNKTVIIRLLLKKLNINNSTNNKYLMLSKSRNKKI